MKKIFYGVFCFFGIMQGAALESGSTLLEKFKVACFSKTVRECTEDDINELCIHASLLGKVSWRQMRCAYIEQHGNAGARDIMDLFDLKVVRKMIALRGIEFVYKNYPNFLYVLKFYYEILYKMDGSPIISDHIVADPARVFLPSFVFLEELRNIDPFLENIIKTTSEIMDFYTYSARIIPLLVQRLENPTNA